MITCKDCKEEYSIKDNNVYSSLLCKCRIIIYYYALGNLVEIEKGEYVKWKNKK